MLGSFRRRGCTCKKKRCTCGAKWHYRYDIVDPKTGNRKQKETRGFDTKDEAEAEAKRILAKLSEGTYVEEKDMLFKDFAKNWIKLYASKKNVKPSTVDIRRSKLQKLLEHFGVRKIKDITKLMYQNMLEDLAERGLARKTIASVHETGSLLFKKAVEMEIIATDPTKFAIVPAIQKTVAEIEEEVDGDLPKYLEKEELALFLKAARLCELENEYVLFLTLAYTGMRIGELLVLKWRDIDFDEHTIAVTKTLYNPKNNAVKYQLSPPKTKKSIRKIDADLIVLNELEKHQARQNLIRMEYRNIYHDKGFVFAREKEFKGYPHTERTIWARMKRLLRLAPLNESLSPHSLRHTHTSLLAEAGVSLEMIMDRLGHESDDITKKIYLHVTKARKKDASQKFSELMRSI